jgi:iron-sulfur cluster assembly accessory protein
MSVETFDVSDQSAVVTATAPAIKHLQQQLAARGLSAVRIHLEKSGCSGYKYVLDEVASPEEGDVIVDLENGVSVCMPEKDVPSLRGMVLDYVQEGVNRNLVINNPNAKDACGCGESFNF